MVDPSFAISLGGLRISIVYLAWMAGFLAAYQWFVLEARQPAQNWMRLMAERTLSAVVVFLLIYKFWPVIEQPQLLLQAPLQLLLYVGGAYAGEAALLASIGWFVYGAFRQKWLGWPMLVKLLTGYMLWKGVTSLIIKEYGYPTGGWGWSTNGMVYLPANLLEGCLFLLLFYLFARRRVIVPSLPDRERAALLVICIMAIAWIKTWVSPVPFEWL